MFLLDIAYIDISAHQPCRLFAELAGKEDSLFSHDLFLIKVLFEQLSTLLLSHSDCSINETLVGCNFIMLCFHCCFQIKHREYFCRWPFTQKAVVLLLEPING